MFDFYRKTLFTLLFFLSAFIGKSQEDPYKIDKYDFINYDKNIIEFFGDSTDYRHVFDLLNNIILKGTGNINIVHIGDSHIQADYFSGRMRQRLQTFFQGGLGGRGFIFPYTVAKTNNPANFSVKYTGEWQSCRNVDNGNDCDLGLSGISVTTFDTLSSITIVLNHDDYPKYDFNKVKIFHPIDSTSFSVEIFTSNGKSIEKTKNIIYNDTLGYTMFVLSDYIDTLNLKFVKTKACQNKFVLHGISLETNDPGIIYHSIGVNGAKVKSYLKCNLFSQHLKALSPDWVIVSLGTNDAYPKYFDSNVFEREYDTLITKIKKAVPHAAILLTVQGDSYRYKKYINHNTLKARQVIYDLAQIHNLAVWDFFTVMGGLNSIALWNEQQLTAHDKLHLSKKGYLLQGNLFFNAFLKKYDQSIDYLNF